MQADTTAKQQGGRGRKRREGLDQRRGTVFAKSIRWAEWDTNREIGWEQNFMAKTKKVSEKER